MLQSILRVFSCDLRHFIIKDDKSTAQGKMMA